MHCRLLCVPTSFLASIDEGFPVFGLRTDVWKGKVQLQLKGLFTTYGVHRMLEENA